MLSKEQILNNRLLVKVEAIEITVSSSKRKLYVCALSSETCPSQYLRHLSQEISVEAATLMLHLKSCKFTVVQNLQSLL